VRDGARFVVSGTRVMARGTYGLVRLARGGHLRESMRPWMRFARAEDIPYPLLAGQGVRAVLFDLENTLVPPGGPFTPEARDVLTRARAAGLRIAVVSNASGGWVGRVLEREGVEFVAPAHKPGRDGFVAACRKLGVRPSQAVFVGDQMITDVVGAQRAGLRAILLEPRYERESLSSRFQRAVTKGLLRIVGE
jgi:hypothetical protein